MLTAILALTAGYTAPIAAPRTALRAAEPAMQLKSVSSNPLSPSSLPCGLSTAPTPAGSHRLHFFLILSVW